MANNQSLIERIRELIAASVLVATLATGTVLVGPEAAEVDEINIAAFNIQVFGKSKRSKHEVMSHLRDIAHEFDLMVVQEIRDASLTTADVFLDFINDEADLTYAMYEGERLGRTNSKEQYVIYYIPAKISFIHAYTWPDDQDVFEREPLIATFQADNFDFTLVICHIKPGDGEDELMELEKIVANILEAVPGEEDIILLGDFNADGDYLNEAELQEIFPLETYQIVITDDMDTMTTSDNTYDRIILMDPTFSAEYVEDSANVFEFDLALGIVDEEQVQTVSDHYPVFATFRTTLQDDD